jgi:hypothetical protein
MTNRTFRNGLAMCWNHCGLLCANAAPIAGSLPIELFAGSPDSAIKFNNHSKL